MYAMYVYSNISQRKEQHIICTVLLLYYMIFHPPVTLPTPTVSARDNTMWTIASPDDSSVERYIVEFECSVRNITFVEKYMSVSASGGTGRVVTSVSCFRGLGQLYRVKVWAVSGPNISRALVCIPDGQCREEGGRHTMTCTVSDYCWVIQIWVWSILLVKSQVYSVTDCSGSTNGQHMHRCAHAFT